MSEPSVAPGKTDAKGHDPLRKGAMLVGGFVVSYALVLTIIRPVMSRSPGNDDMKVLAKRFAVIALVAVVMVAVPLVVDVRYLYPFMGVGFMAFGLGSRALIDQKRRA